MIYILNCFGLVVNVSREQPPGPCNDISDDIKVGENKYLGKFETGKNITLVNIKRSPGGRRPVERLINKGMEPSALESSIRFVVMAQIYGYDRPQDVAGFSQKSLPQFASELRQTAQHIDMIRANPFYGNILDSWIPSLRWEVTCKDLRAYADLWESLIRVVKMRAKHDPRAYDLRLSTKFKLMRQVAAATGSPNFELVATVLNAAYDLAGLSLTEESSALRHLWRNRNRKARYRRWASMMSS